MDKYSKLLLTIIAVCLVADLASSKISTPARADAPLNVKIVGIETGYHIRREFSEALPKASIVCSIKDKSATECVLKWE